jgi:hypothetical protein
MSGQYFHFDEYVVRPMSERDRDYLDTLIEDDAYHKGRMTPDYFLNLLPGEDAWALEDEQGNVLFYFKTQTAVRVSIQFTGSKTKEEKQRNRTALVKGLAWIETMLRQNHFREMIFDTQGPELAAFAKRRLGFTASSCELIRPITPPRPPGRAVTDWDAVPQVSRRSG